MITLNMSLCLCQCVHVTECPKDPLLDVTVRYILLSGDQGAFAKVSTLMYNIVTATVGQQQDVFPERKRGWEERPNVDLFLLLSFLFWLSKSGHSE